MSDQLSSMVMFGHSHIAALESGFGKFQSECTPPFSCSFLQLWGKYILFYTASDDETIYNPELLSAICSAVSDSKANYIASVLFGKEYLVASFARAKDMFDLIVPDRPYLFTDNRGVLVPYDALFDHAYNSLYVYLQLMATTNRYSGVPILNLLPPPPSWKYRISLQERATPLARISKKYFLPSSGLLLKMWYVYMAAPRKVCPEINVRVVDPPIHAIDPSGIPSFFCSINRPIRANVFRT